MNRYTTYHIKETDRFDLFNFPKVEAELMTIAQATAAIQQPGKQQAIISFLKNHSIRTEWINANPALAKNLSSNNILTSHLEALFDSGKNNSLFIRELEECICKKLE